MPDRSKEMTQTKRDTLVLQGGGWAWGWRPHPGKKNLRYEHLEDASDGLEEKSWKHGRVEARFEGGQGPEGAVAKYMDGWRIEI
jgi:hypothetical protein